jgi:hypothetical protein
VRFKLKLPGVSATESDVILHYVGVFVFAFGTQALTGVTKVHSESEVLALLTSAGAAGVAAVVHVLLGLIPNHASVKGVGMPFSPVGISLKVKSSVNQILTSAVVVFISILGAELVGGAVHVTSLPAALAVAIAAIAAAVTAVAQYVIGLVPAPKA